MNRTPGDWIFREDDMLVIRKAPGLLDTLHIAKVCRQGPNTEANAHLIAAAPELYEALVDCSALLGVLIGPNDDFGNAIIRKANIALAKAEGKP